MATDGSLDTGKVFTGQGALDAVAKEVLNAVHPISEQFNVEIGGRIVASGDGYSYEMPVVGDAGSVHISGLGAVAGYHTHPGGANYSTFSNQYNSPNGGPGDAGWVSRNGIPLYMSNNAGAGVNISVCSFGSARCRTNFVPQNGVNRGISGTPVY